jgi:hypothetical protein
MQQLLGSTPPVADSRSATRLTKAAIVAQARRMQLLGDGDAGDAYVQRLLAAGLLVRARGRGEFVRVPSEAELVAWGDALANAQRTSRGVAQHHALAALRAATRFPFRRLPRNALLPPGWLLDDGDAQRRYLRLVVS